MNAFESVLIHGVGFGDVTLLAIRGGVGGFFIISGYRKLFNRTRREVLRETFAADGVRFAPMMYAIPLAEFLGGLGVAFGVLTLVAAVGPIPWTPWCGGFARVFTMLDIGNEARNTFALQAVGLFACAEAGGEFTLSRTEPGQWESFCFEPDAS